MAKISLQPTFFGEHEPEKMYRFLAGVDEAGRGPLAGPVVAAAVIFPQDIDPHLVAGIHDSKQMSESARERYFEVIKQNALAYGIAEASAREIEEINILQASLLAMKRAIESLKVIPEYVLVDGNHYPPIDLPGEAVVKGDQKHLAISAASVLAKVTRDRMMDAMHVAYPRYGFDQHKGYPTEYHRIAVKLFGPSPEHRRTYAGVIEYPQAAEWTPAFAGLLSLLENKAGENENPQMIAMIQNAELNPDEYQYLLRRSAYLQKGIKQKKRLQTPSSVDKGRHWEDIAVGFLEKKGYRIWERNFNGAKGEIDIIASQEKTLVFVEVKARRTRKFGTPSESVTPKKQKSIISTAEEFLYKRHLHNQGWDIRYDVISVFSPKNEQPEIELIEDAFRLDDDSVARIF